MAPARPRLRCGNGLKPPWPRRSAQAREPVTRSWSCVWPWSFPRPAAHRYLCVKHRHRRRVSSSACKSMNRHRLQLRSPFVRYTGACHSPQAEHGSCLDGRMRETTLGRLVPCDIELISWSGTRWRQAHCLEPPTSPNGSAHLHTIAVLSRYHLRLR